MKKLLLTLMGVVCSLGMSWADDSTFGITRTIASSETTTDKSTSGAAVTGKKVSDDTVVGSTSDVTVAIAHGVESDMIDKARNTYWYNSSSIKCYVDKGTHNYRTTTKTLGDNNYFAFTLTIASGKAVNIKSINGDIMMDGDNTSYQMAIINNEGTEVYTSITKACKKSESAAKSVAVSDLTEAVQTALAGMTGKVTVKMRWTNTANTGKYCIIKDFNVVAEVVTAAAQTKYSKPTITQGAYDQPTGKYAVTIAAAEGETGTISYKIGDGEYQTYSEVIAVTPSTKVTAKVSGSSYSESDEKEFTTSGKPQLATPTYKIDSYNFATQKYAVTLVGATGAKIYYTTDNWTTYPEYTEAINVAASTTVKVKAKQNNMADSKELVFATPAAPTDGTHTTPKDGSQPYTDGTSYNAGAYTIAANPTYLGGTIGSGNSSINGCIKMRLSRQADPTDFNDKYGFHLDVNPGYVITSAKLQILNNYNTDIAATGIYVDDATTTNLLASPVTLPYASASSVAAAEVKAENIAATNRIVFTFDKNTGTDNPNQAQVLITVTYVVPEYKKSNAEVGYGTMYYEKELAIPAGMKVYTGKLSGSYLALTEVENVIPASTAVLYTGEGVFTPSFTGAAAIADNDLKGVAAETAVSTITGGTVCVLGYEDSKAGFYKYTGEKLAANKAYLVVPEESAAKGITLVFDEGTATAISQIENGELKIENSAAYNLAGQRVAANQKGIVIINGKKFINK